MEAEGSCQEWNYRGIMGLGGVQVVMFWINKEPFGHSYLNNQFLCVTLAVRISPFRREMRDECKSREGNLNEKSFLCQKEKQKEMTKKEWELTLIVLHNANFQLVTNGVENEIAALRQVPQLAHGVHAVAHNQMTLQDWVGLWTTTKTPWG